jgi:hypothetical protein
MYNDQQTNKITEYQQNFIYYVVLLCGERRVKKHCFHEWGRKKSRVVFGVSTSENNVFALLKQAQ